MRLFFALLFMIVGPVSISTAASLESRGWKKTVDDFEGTVEYIYSAEPYAFGCMGLLAGVVASVAGEPKEVDKLTIGVMGAGMEEGFREGTLRFRTENGIVDLPTNCSSDYSDGKYNVLCLSNADSGAAKQLATTDFVRLDTPSKNFDMKADNKCASALSGINKVGLDFYETTK
ncbi:hypothetical protein N8275_11700 [Pseudomonadales bacterium]|nr:hypothetical protein [Pseudomonadales bacterium]